MKTPDRARASALPEGGRYLHRLPPTPLVPVRLAAGQPPVWCKLEFLNPSGSTKDRIARFILEKAWREGRVESGSTVVEASSGSTSIALALACAQLGLKFVAFIPTTATSERELIIRAYGGEVRRIEGGMTAVIAGAEEFARRTGAFATRQFANPDNAEAHRAWTGPEILSQVEGGCVDAVVSGVGTGGTLCGLWQAFRDAGCPARAFAAIPACGDSFASNPECCSLRFSGRVPGVVDGLSEIYEGWKSGAGDDGPREVGIADDICLETTRRLWRLGFPVGPSSGLNFAAASEVVAEMGPGARVVTVFPDRMERYFSHPVFGDDVRA